MFKHRYKHNGYLPISQKKGGNAGFSFTEVVASLPRRLLGPLALSDLGPLRGHIRLVL